MGMLSAASGSGKHRTSLANGLRMVLQEELGRWPDLQYCKTDLISTKGVVFCKFARSSSALRTLEAVTESGQVNEPRLPVAA